MQYVCSWYIMIGENPWMHTIRHLVMCDRKGEVKNTTLFPFLHSLFNSSTSLFPSLPPSLFLPLLLTSLYRMGRSSGMGWSTTLVVCSAMVSPTHEQCSSHDNHMLPTGTRKDQELCVRLIDSTTKQVSTPNITYH